MPEPQRKPAADDWVARPSDGLVEPLFAGLGVEDEGSAGTGEDPASDASGGAREPAAADGLLARLLRFLLRR